MSRPVATAFTRQAIRLRTAQHTFRYYTTPTSRPLFSTCNASPRPPPSRAQLPLSIFTRRAMSSSSESPAVVTSTGAEETVPCVGEASEKKADEVAPVAETQDAAEAEEEEPKLPPLTPAQFREYNRLAEHMDHFVSCDALQSTDCIYFARLLTRYSTTTSARYGP